MSSISGLVTIAYYYVDRVVLNLNLLMRLTLICILNFNLEVMDG